MVDKVDWRARYRECVLEVEAREREFRLLEAALRRLVSRLCAAALGVDPRLDEQLARISQQRDAGATSLDLLADQLRDIVARIRDHAPSTAAPQPARIALAGFLRKLLVTQGEDEAVTALLQAVDAAATTDELGALLERASTLIASRAARLMRERTEAQALLNEVTARLEDVTAYLAGLASDRSGDRDAAETLNLRVLSQVEDLNADVQSATTLEPLQRAITGRLAIIADYVRDYRDTHEQRYVAQSARAAKMTKRIIELEREARRLQSDLDVERQQSRADPMTGVPNRRAFDERLQVELKRFGRHPQPTTLLLWDIDRFKRINDSFGHRAGDRVLREVAQCLASRLRAGDLVARVGGEEFATLLIGTPMNVALQVASELREAIAALKLHFRGEPVQVTASCGAAEFVAGDTPASLLERTDGALYRAKDAGRNACVAA